MKWLSKLLKRPSDSLAPLHREPTDEERWALRAEWQHQDMLDALIEGEQVISGLTNAAYGGRGYSLCALEVAGLMRCTPEMGLPGELGRYRYTPTAAGRAKARA